MKQEFKVERTRAGLQFVIPGTEMAAQRPKINYSSEEGQFVLPGTERLSIRTLFDLMGDRPIRPRVAQRSLAGTALFSRRHER